MTKKFKLVGGGVAVGALLLFLLFGSDALSYVSTSISKVHNSVKGSVPVDFELERARNEVEKITPEIAEARNLGDGPYEDCNSPPSHSAFSDAEGLVQFLQKLQARPCLTKWLHLQQFNAAFCLVESAALTQMLASDWLLNAIVL